MEEYEQLVLLTLKLKISNLWENDLVKEFPKASFIIQDGHVSSNKNFEGLLKIGNADIQKIKRFLSDYNHINLDSFHKKTNIYFYEVSNCFLAKTTKDKKCRFNWPIAMHGEYKYVKLIMKRKYVDALIGAIEKKKIEVVGMSIINVDFDFNYFLTPKQKEILVPCLKYGYYQFPKKISLNGLSEKLGISPSTLCVHLQKIESKVFNSDHSDLFFKNLHSI